MRVEIDSHSGFCFGVVRAINFVLETEELLDFVYQHIDRLNARLEKLGYNTHFEMKVAADSSDRLDFVKDFIEAEARPAAGGQYIFDAKA